MVRFRLQLSLYLRIDGPIYKKKKMNTKVWILSTSPTQKEFLRSLKTLIAKANVELRELRSGERSNQSFPRAKIILTPLMVHCRAFDSTMPLLALTLPDLWLARLTPSQ